MSANNLHKVAIIVPVFNAEKTLKRCLDSIVHQTLDDYEVIVINDGSFDHSLKIATKYAVKYHFLKVIDQPNKGLFVTRQEGIRLANSEYIGWVDADDFVDKTMFSTLYNQAVINDSELVYCGYNLKPYIISFDNYSTALLEVAWWPLRIQFLCQCITRNPRNSFAQVWKVFGSRLLQQTILWLCVMVH